MPDKLSSKCKILFQVDGKGARLADKENLIFDVYDGRNYGHYLDSNGNPVPEKESYNVKLYDDKEVNIWDREWIANEELEEPLIAESTTELEWEIDDAFGNFGFKNRAGEFVIEPQYAYAREFTKGLAAVNINRTWYKTEDGKRYYENHFGYINERGQTVIPFAYDEAYEFNKYGFAVVKDLGHSYLIDINGNRPVGTDKYEFSSYYDYGTRYFEIYNFAEDYTEDPPIGLFDTKECKVILEPIADDIIIEDDDLFRIYDRNGKYGVSDFHQYYINRKGEKLFPWLIDKGFATVEVPNEHLNSIVSVSKYYELEGLPSSCYIINGKEFDRNFIYGVYSSQEEMIIPLEYEEITELSENIYGCVKGGTVTVIQVEM